MLAIVVTYKLTGIEVLTRTQVVNAIKNALRLLGEYWCDAFAWKRFTELGYSEYGFRRRSRKYDAYKQKHLGHRNPLVAKGETQRETLSENTKRRIRVTRDSVRIPLPTKVNRYNPKGPNLSEEIRAVSREELRILEEHLVLWIDSELDKQVPPQLRRRGEIGGRASRVRLRTLRPTTIAEPAARRAAA